tara:strand:+ start:95 stop:961 length:867 start_codon:yes stop_codon:yes gene_type:complete
MNDGTKKLLEIIKKNKIDCKFTIIEIGALEVSKKEPFYELLDHFPSSKIIGFEIEEEVCDQMNLKAPKGVEYYPHALGEKNERKKLYITQHPMCTSLYKPNEKLIRLYNNLEVAHLKEETETETITLDTFVDKYNINDVDFIKADVQGAELDIFKGGKNVLKNVIKIICEVEFLPIYENQPLFGDICNFLNQNDFMFNKFLGFAGRTLRPLVAKEGPNAISQCMYSDAVFIHHIEKVQNLNDEKLLKLSLLSAIYNSIDLAYFCLLIYDKRKSSNIAKDWINPPNGKD